MRNGRKIGSRSKDTKPAAANWAALSRKRGEQANLPQGCAGVGVYVSGVIRAEVEPGIWKKGTFG